MFFKPFHNKARTQKKLFLFWNILNISVQCSDSPHKDDFFPLPLLLHWTSLWWLGHWGDQAKAVTGCMLISALRPDTIWGSLGGVTSLLLNEAEHGLIAGTEALLYHANKSCTQILLTECINNLKTLLSTFESGCSVAIISMLKEFKLVP